MYFCAEVLKLGAWSSSRINSAPRRCTVAAAVAYGVDAVGADGAGPYAGRVVAVGNALSYSPKPALSLDSGFIAVRDCSTSGGVQLQH